MINNWQFFRYISRCLPIELLALVVPKEMQSKERCTQVGNTTYSQGRSYIELAECTCTREKN
jgi:hypothetical protein